MRYLTPDKLKPRPETGSARRLAGLSVLLLVAFWPTLQWLWQAWLYNPYYSHGFLIPPLSAFLVWQERRRLADLPRRPVAAGVVLLAGGILVHLLALPWQAHFISALTLLAVLTGISLSLWGWPVTRNLLFPIILLLSMIPLPALDRLSPPLEAFAANSGAALVRWIGVPAESNGAQVSLSNSSFVVGAPCSGLRSLVALVTLAALVAYEMTGPLTGRLVLLLLAIPVALLANLVRVTLLFWIAHAFGPEAALTYYHDWAGLVVFLVALAVLLALARLIEWFVVRSL